MKGRNEIRLCEAALIEILQEWADTTMADADATVASVRALHEGGSMVFVLVLEDAAAQP